MININRPAEDRLSMNIHGMSRSVHRVAKVKDEDTGEWVSGYVTEDVGVTIHDIYKRDKRKFWRGACLA
jgi:hypothetical protein